MRIRIEFGYMGDKFEFGWFRDILDFPKLLRYKGSTFEWSMYNKDPSGKVDQILTFAKVYSSPYSTVSGDIPDFEQHFGALVKRGNCECGANHTSFPQFHMQFCPEYGKIKKNEDPPDETW